MYIYRERERGRVALVSVYSGFGWKPLTIHLVPQCTLESMQPSYQTILENIFDKIKFRISHMTS